MARINESAFKNWQDGETIKAAGYNQEREIIRVAINDNDTRIIQSQEVANGLNQRVTLSEQGLSQVTAQSEANALEVVRHRSSQDHDVRYYTKGETDTRIIVMSGGNEFIDGGTFLDFYPDAVGNFDGGEW